MVACATFHAAPVATVSGLPFQALVIAAVSTALGEASHYFFTVGPWSHQPFARPITIRSISFFNHPGMCFYPCLTDPNHDTALYQHQARTLPIPSSRKWS